MEACGATGTHQAMFSMEMYCNVLNGVVYSLMMGEPVEFHEYYVARVQEKAEEFKRRVVKCADEYVSLLPDEHRDKFRNIIYTIRFMEHTTPNGVDRDLIRKYVRDPDDDVFDITGFDPAAGAARIAKFFFE